jgi:hypothetical protein
MRALSIAAIAAVLVLAGCAGVEPVGRNAQRAEQQAPAATRAPAPRPAATQLPPPAPATTPQPAPQQQATLTPPPAQAAPTPQTAAPQIVTPAPAPAPVQQAAAQPPRRALNTSPNNDEVIVPGQVQRQVLPPQADPRSNSERMEDIRAWDRCVIEVQGAALDSDPTSPQLETPEDVCRNELGMAERTAVPITRRIRNR